MKTVVSTAIPDSTYFRTGNVEPVVNGDTITLTEGRGSRRSWGAPQVNNTIVVNDCDFCAVLTGFSHKHGGGQFWRYFIRQESGEIVRKTWAQLTDDERQTVLDNLDKAPGWAKSPGKMRADYVKPTDTRFDAYKILRVIGDDEFESLYDSTRWTLNKRNGQAVADDAGVDEYGRVKHDGGFYVHEDADKIRELWASETLVPADRITTGTYALVRCECSGRVRRFSSGKLAVTYCRPVEVVETFTV